ncbi:MAG: Gfo/Idh/MocA family protein [Betaproteobacteria bacterium]
MAWGYPPAGKPDRASTHLEAYRVREIECAGGCDPDAEARQRFTAATGLAAYADPAALLAAHPVDVVSICSPDAVHFAHTALALAKGVKRVWLEKPPAENAGQARELIGLAKRAGATVAVNYFRRYHPCFEKMRDLVKRDALGPVRSLRVQYSRGLLTNGSHQIDLVGFLLGDGKQFSKASYHGVPLHVVGAELPYHVQETEILCEEGRMLALQGGAALRIDAARPNPAYPGFMHLESGIVDTFDNPGHCFPVVLDDLLASHRAGRPPRSSLATALQAMEICEAIAHGDPGRRG